MANFFITGLPRTRTSWLANLFTDGGRLCYHDLISQASDMTQLRTLLGAHHGDSDSGLLFFFPRLAREFPAARWILVIRDLQQVLNSLAKAATGTPWARDTANFLSSYERWRAVYFERVKQMRADPRVQIVHYDALDNYEQVSALWQWINPARELCPHRFAILDRLKIEPVPAKNPLRVASSLVEELCQ